MTYKKNKLKEQVAAILGYFFCIQDDNSVEFNVKTDEKTLDKFSQYVMDNFIELVSS